MDEHEQTESTRRIIIIDDSEAIHKDYEKVLGESNVSASEKSLKELDSLMFDEEKPASESDEHKIRFEIDHAYQGKEGYEMIIQQRDRGIPYSVAFVDMRMPPGWDGLQTIEKIWDKDPDLQIVICSAYADYSFHQIIARIGHSDRLLILKKPFDQAEVFQMAAALSEKWLAQQSTKELLKSLEGKVEARTLELRSANDNLHRLNEELQVAAEEANCASRAKGRFLATMSHEIRTTLNGIMGASQMLNDTELEPGQAEFGSIIQTSGEALMTIINDILDYSKYEVGQLDLESIPFSLESLVKDCTSLLKSVVERNNVELCVIWDESIPDYLDGDPARLRQILLNLLNNALKFGGNGKVTLECALINSNAGKANLKISIADQGIGMTEETIGRLFSVFMQADSSTTREYGGTGLGLAICKLLADAMKAKILVDSEVGKGSKFSIYIPLPVSDVNFDKEKQPRDDKKEEIARKRYEGKRVLLVDDHAINRKLGSHFLKSFGIITETANDGKDAVETATSNDYDLILMDLQMPEMGGIDATLTIRNSGEKYAKLPIIALTANAFNDIEEKCLSNGMNDFITKPLKRDMLAAVLDKWMPEVHTNS